MLTPRFELCQTENDITITIHAPYANVAETEIFVAEQHFRFFSSPYYLRLHLPGSVEETDSSACRYEADTGHFVVRISKVTQGEHFPDLDLLTTLLAPRKARENIGKAAIEVIDSQDVDQTNADEDADNDSEWYMEQSLSDPSCSLIPSAPTYGFASQYSQVFTNFKHELGEILDLADPDGTPASERESMQLLAEAEHFCEDHYLADLMEDETIQQLMLYDATASHTPDVVFSVEEVDRMKELPNREYLLSSSDKQALYCGLVDILYGYCYNKRINEGENNPESAWTINKISATLCWLRCFSSLEDAVKSCIRRSLIYPLYRHYGLAVKVAADVQCILSAGKKQVLRCLLEILNLFNANEPRYLLNQLYVQDYCIWVQQSSGQQLAELCLPVPTLADLDLDLVELENAARLVVEEEVDGLSQQMAAMSLPQPKQTSTNAARRGSSDSSDSSDCSDCSDSSDSSSCSSETSLDSDDLSEQE